MMIFLRKFIFCVVFIAAITMSAFSQTASNTGSTSIAMLNYLATQTRIVNGSKDNRLVLEEIYNKLINNTNPSIIDETTQDYLLTLLNSIESFRMLTIQRERLQYIFENEQAQAITQALPNPLYLLGTRDKSPLSLIATTVAMTIDSIFKFQSAQNNAQMEFLKNNWELDDNESAALHNMRTKALSYMIDIARSYKLAMSDTLNEQSIDNFVKYTQDENLQRRRQALENNRSLYGKYGPYWLVLAETYYDLEMYRECITAVQEYEKIRSLVLRKDYDFARLIPKIIMAISNVYGTNATYLNQTKEYLDKLITNTTDADWALRYFAAQTYISMASTSDRRSNLTAAYNLLMGNVTYLSKEQEALLAAYIAPIDETIPRGTTKEKEKKIKKMISELKKQRKTELPPMHEGLLMNYQVLFALFQELNTAAAEIKRVNAIVDKAFVNPQLRHQYFSEPLVMDNITLTHDGSFDTLDLVVPAVYLDENTKYPIDILDKEGNSILGPRLRVSAFAIDIPGFIEKVKGKFSDVSYKISSVKRNITTSLNDYMATIYLYIKNIKFDKKEKYEIIIYLINGELVTELHFEKKAGENKIYSSNMEQHEKSYYDK